ncbi:MAG: metallophosphoesterase, partial [Candidatus Bathyarchaeia archaeon]
MVASAGAYGYLYLGGAEEGQEGQETQVWWIASDPHVGYGTVDSLGVGIEDVNEYVEKIEGVEVDYAILLGDIINESSWYRGRFLRSMDNLKVENWYYVLGNHDFENPPWEENLLPPVDTMLNVMGMKWILISDHMGDTYGAPPEAIGGTMPEDVKAWVVD